MRHMEIAKAFTAVLRRHRCKKKITQEILAKHTDITSKMASLIERNERNPSLNVADFIAQGLGVSLAQIIKKTEAIRQRR